MYKNQHQPLLIPPGGRPSPRGTQVGALCQLSLAQLLLCNLTLAAADYTSSRLTVAVLVPPGLFLKHENVALAWFLHQPRQRAASGWLAQDPLWPCQRCEGELSHQLLPNSGTAVLLLPRPRGLEPQGVASGTCSVHRRDVGPAREPVPEAAYHSDTRSPQRERHTWGLSGSCCHDSRDGRGAAALLAEPVACWRPSLWKAEPAVPWQHGHWCGNVDLEGGSAGPGAAPGERQTQGSHGVCEYPRRPGRGCRAPNTSSWAQTFSQPRPPRQPAEHPRKPEKPLGHKM